MEVQSAQPSLAASLSVLASAVLLPHGKVLETTADHPFYVIEAAPRLAEGQTAGRWVDAGELAIGDRIWKADGSTDAVESVEVVAVEQRMYNLTVDVAHTFFVGQPGWLVHNCDVPQLRLGHSDDLLKSDVLDHWQSQSTDDIVRSLLKDSDEHLAFVRMVPYYKVIIGLRYYWIEVMILPSSMNTLTYTQK